jgi:hypothetical protein
VSDATAKVQTAIVKWGDDVIKRQPVNVVQTWYSGIMVGINPATGNAVWCDDTVEGVLFDGINIEADPISLLDTTSATQQDPAYQIPVERPFRFVMAIASANGGTDIGKPVYAIYNNQVAYSGVNNWILVGYVEQVLTSGGVPTTSTGTSVVIRPAYNVSNKKINLGPTPTDTYTATMTIDATFSMHTIAASETNSATATLTPSTAGSSGDVMVIQTEADSSGTVTITFASTFHPNGTQATGASKFSAIEFISDGTRWIELSRTSSVS